MITYCVYCVYGIEAIKDGISAERSEALFNNLDDAKDYADRFNRLKLSPIHLNDVINDVINDKNAKKL